MRCHDVYWWQVGAINKTTYRKCKVSDNGKTNYSFGNESNTHDLNSTQEIENTNAKK